MRKIALTLIVAGAAFATEASSQVIVRANAVPPGQRPPDGMCRVWIENVPAGRQPRATNCATAQATAPLNSRIIVGANAPFPGRAVGRSRDGDCEFERRPSSIGDIILGRRTTNRNGDRDCRVASGRESGVWYPVDRDRNGNVIYERRTRTRDGRIVVERARSRNGRDFERIGSRRGSRVDRDTDSDSDRRAGRDRDSDRNRRGVRRDRDSDRSRISGAVRNREKAVRDQQKAMEKARRDREKTVRKAQRDREKAIERARRGNGNGRGNRG